MNFFDNFFRNICIPVLVCHTDNNLTCVYENITAISLLNPIIKEQTNPLAHEELPLDAILHCSKKDFSALVALTQTVVAINRYIMTVKSYAGKRTQVTIDANQVELDGEIYWIFYIRPLHDIHPNSITAADVLNTALHLTYIAKTTDEAINNILAFIGTKAHVSRSYIFESISDSTTSNTYEWCAPGIEPVIQDLQDLPKDQYSYDGMIGRGVFVTDDIRLLSEEDRAVLEPQGIKSLAILVLYYQNAPLGYVGFDDCENYRKWSKGEIQMLSDLADLLASLLIRRNTERQVRQSLEVLQTITDNTDSIVYVSDIRTYNVIFINKPLLASLGVDPADIIGKKCWQTMQKDMNGTCPFCPLPVMLNPDGTAKLTEYIWEFQNTITKKWYLVRDAIIKWIDDRYVHIETATEITQQKEYEAKLEYVASIDAMTEVYNRDWGSKIINNILLTDNEQTSSLVFIDIDGLKQVNDTLGHEQGDNLIIHALAIIKANVRKSDFVCRWGGDEFVLILRGGVNEAETVMHNITEMMDQHNSANTDPFTISLSFGITELKYDDQQTIDSIIARADKLMYQNKGRHRSNVLK